MKTSAGEGRRAGLKSARVGVGEHITVYVGYGLRLKLQVTVHHQMKLTVVSVELAAQSYIVAGPVARVVVGYIDNSRVRYGPLLDARHLAAVK